MNRGEGTTPPATKSGRKVKRPAHFDDSPEPASPGKVKREVAAAAPESVKKSARKTLALAGTPPSKNGSDSESGEGAGKKSARKTLAKNGSREESPEPEVKKAAPASARKTLLKSAVQNSSAEGGGTPKKTPAKKVEPEQDSEAGPGLSRTGRKIKVPAHLKEFEDVVVPAVTGRKSVAPKKEEPEAVPKSATKAKTIVRQLATEHEEEKPQPKTPAKAKQARKAAEEDEEEAKPVTKTPGRARSVARKTAEEEEENKPATKTPGRARSVARKTAEDEEDTKPAPKARGRSVARKASVDEPTPFEEKPAPKTYGRARSVARQTEEDEKPKSPIKPVEAPKTPARTKSVPRRFAEDDEEPPKPTSKTPGRAKSMAARKPSIDEPAQPSKTPSRRAKSIAPQSKPEHEEVDPLALPEEPPKPQSPPKKQPIKTPSKPRAKSVARDPSPEPPQKSDPSEPAPTSRSGRKIKPKKYFGEFEQDESVPAVIPTVAASPKVAATSPVKSPRVVVASPVRSPQQQIVKKGSPYAPMKDLPVVVAKAAATTTPPVKRLSVPEKKSPAATVVVPTKKAKKDDADGEGSPFKISPATEERQITKRNVNDHHHQQVAAASNPESPKVVVVKVASSPVAAKSVSPPKKAKLDSPKPELPAVSSEPELLAEQDPLASSTSTSTSSVAPTESSEATTPPAPPKEVEDKPKRGRKTLPAGPSSDDSGDVPKPKTPGRKTMAPVVTPAASLEEPGSSRSGRKIKPKKFFDDGEPAAPVTKVKPEVATPAGRGGKRKTIVPKEDKEEEEEKKEEEPELEEKQEEPKASVSREEIMAIVGDFGEVAAPVVEPAAAAVDTPTEAEPMNGTPEETSDATVTVEPTTTTTTVEEPAAEVDQPAAADPIEEPAAATSTVEPAEPEPQDASDGAAAATTDVLDEVTEASAGNFPETPIEQTPPIAAEPEMETEMVTEKTTEEPTTAPTVPDDPAVSVEEPEAEPEPAVAEQSASSAFSEALVVEEESAAGAGVVEAAAAAGGPTVEQKMEELFESVEFLEESSGRLSDVTAAAAAVADGVPAELLEQQLGEVMGEPEVPVEEPVQAEEEEDLNKTEPPSTLEEPTLESVQQEEEEEDLNKTEPPAALNDTVEDVGLNQEEDLLATSMPDEVDEFFAENDRSQESITVLPETPKQKPSLEQEDLDLVGKLPEPQQSSSNTVAFVEIPTPATPKTPESKPVISKDDYSPDKPDAQELASEPQELQLQAPPEIIEILDSPVVVTAVESAAEKQATSTPVGPSSKLTVKERIIQNSRKRSLSASDADLSTKKNVTFHSPANSTILVDTLDERLKKSLKADSTSKTARKRSLSEHKEMGPVVDGPKPSKISKLPNFKNIHQNQFSRMESIAEYHNRKVQRAKDILTNSASKSPAKGSLVRGATPQKSAPHSGQKNGSSVATQLKFSAAPRPASHSTTATSSSSTTTGTGSTSKPLLSDEARQEKRQQQFNAGFKPKTAAATLAANAGKSHQDSPDGARRVVEQSRHKQHQILKGVRTNKRFELLMKFRDAAQD